MRSSRTNRFREQTKRDCHRPCGSLRRNLGRHGNPSAGSTGMDSGKHPRRSFCPRSLSRLSPPAIFYCRLCVYRTVSDSSSGRRALYLRPNAARVVGKKHLSSFAQSLRPFCPRSFRISPRTSAARTGFAFQRRASRGVEFLAAAGNHSRNKRFL